ncbi:MAG: phosphatase PAP2 family protein [Lachnospiraceae bacterium]|nr:phosphatase PAP2 family protein [Lachnospiraceae bacterium]
MTEEDYRHFSECIRNNKNGEWMMNLMDRLIVAITVASYPMLLVYLYQTDFEVFTRTLILPAVAFLVVSLFRRFFNQKRPYEVYDFEPVIHRKGTGKSMPSRHVFSIFMIAMCFFQVDLSLGFTFCIMGTALALLRVYGGVHFVKDVIVGALVAIISGGLGFFIL